VTTVAIVGPGRVGTLLGAACTRAGWRVVAVAGGSEASRAAFAARVAGARSVADPTAAVRGVDLVWLTVPDDAIEPLVTELAVADAFGEGQRVVHVAGSRGLDVLRRAALSGARVAACHPAMTVPTGATDPDLLVGVAWAVTAASDADRAWAHDVVTDLGGDPHDVPDAARTLYHAALAVASNAVGAAVVTARRLLLAARVDRPEAFLGPLVEASVANAAARGAAALTGPIVRGDVGTIGRHLDAITADLPELADAYRYLALATLEPVRPALPAETVAALQALLAGAEGAVGDAPLEPPPPAPDGPAPDAPAGAPEGG
jgi:predicted short-subunit dehydrogenase-like oxidoreductase (DUF2520 family)